MGISSTIYFGIALVFYNQVLLTPGPEKSEHVWHIFRYVYLFKLVHIALTLFTAFSEIAFENF